MKALKYIVLLGCLICLDVIQTKATHIRAGDISVQRVDTGNPNALVYDIIVNLYRDTRGVEFQSGEIDFGDNTSITLEQNQYIAQGLTGFEDTEHYIVTIRHTYPSAGRFTVSFFERNRNESVCNMFASGQTPFYIQSEFFITPFLGFNQTPVLLIPPLDKGVQGQRYIHNPGAFDPDGDSLSFELTTPKQAKDLDVANYRDLNDPAFSISQEDGSVPALFYMDPMTGDFDLGCSRKLYLYSI